jgi:Cytochrome oxidase complex assembly protein 1
MGAPELPKRAGTRNVPVAIGLGCFAVLVLGCLFIVGALTLANVAMRSSEAYQLALAAAQRDPSVAAELGAPVSSSWFTTGQIEVFGSGSEATLEIPISGPRGSGTLAVRATKSAGKWTFSTLNVRISGRSAPLDLLAATTP